MSNMYAIQFDLILHTAVEGTFLFFDAWFNLVQLTSIVFSFPLPFGVLSPPDGQLVVFMR